MAGDDVTITIRANNGDAIRAFRDVNGRLRDMRGRFVSESGIMSGAMRQLSTSIGSLLPVTTAAVPAAAALGVATLKAGSAAAGAGAAVAAFGIAVAGQAGKLSEAADAQDKYNDAVFKYGQGSKQAAEAQRTVQSTFASMPASTARAAVSLSTLKDGFQDWSDSVADFTMTPVEKSFTLLGQLVPRLTDMAKGASSQLDRLVTVAGGAMATPGFDALSDKLSTFANESLRDAVDGVIHFARALSEGQVGGPVQAFMEYANSNGPALRETLSTVGDAVTTLVEAAAEAGPGMLTLVNAAAGLVASLPPELVATVMKLAVALKLVTLAGAGAAAISAGIATLGARIAALQAASAAAGGGMAGLAAAFGTLGKAAKASIIVAGIGALVYAVSKLSDIGEKAPPNVDRLTTSLGQLGASGKVTGEAAKAFGEDFGKLRDQINKVTDPSVVESINNWGADVSNGILDAGDATEEFTKSMDSIDKSLTNLVRGGKADLARAALGEMLKGMSPEQAEKFRSGLDGYKSALEDLKFEQELAAQSMGVFAGAAQDTSAKLEAQKGAADGLRASIVALNDVNRSAYEAQIGFEASLDSLTASFKEHGATLNLDTDAGRANAQAMVEAARSQDELIASGLAAGESLGSMTKKSNELRETMMRLAVDAFDGNKQKATEYVNTLLGMPGEIKTLVKLEREEAITGLKAVQAEIEATPGAKSIKVDTLNGAAIKALEAVGLKTKQLPDGRTQVFTANGQAIGSIGAVRKALDNLNGKTANTYTKHHVTTYSQYVNVGPKSSVPGSRFLKEADGGVLQFFANGGTREQHIAQIAPAGSMRVWAEPETGGEAYIPLARGKRSRSREVAEETVSILGGEVQWFAKGGLTKKQRAAQERAKAEREARSAARGDLTISHFGQMAGYKTSEIIGQLGRADSLGDLVNSLNKWRSIIKAATHGAQERGLLKALDSAGKKLLSWEKQLGKVEASLGKAKDKLNDLKSAASQLSGSVKSGILSSANITRGASGDGPVTVASIMGGLTASRDKATAFSKALAGLKKKGLSSALLQQIAEAGIEGGGLETAGALLQASGSEIKSLNSLQSQIGKAAGSAGKTTADAVFGAQIKAQQAYVTMLTKQQDRLEKSMEKLAKSMEKLIEKAFKGKAAGGIVGAAASGGIRSNLTWVGEQGPELVNLAPGSRVWSNPDSRRMQQQAWASMLNEPRMRHAPGRAAVAGASGRPEPVVIELRSSGSDMDELLLKILRKAINVRGGNAQVVLTGRTS